MVKCMFFFYGAVNMTGDITKVNMRIAISRLVMVRLSIFDSLSRPSGLSRSGAEVAMFSV